MKKLAKKIVNLLKRVGKIGILHNDPNLAPNIMEKDGRFYLIDYGEAKATTSLVKIFKPGKPKKLKNIIKVPITVANGPEPNLINIWGIDYYRFSNKLPLLFKDLWDRYVDKHHLRHNHPSYEDKIQLYLALIL